MWNNIFSIVIPIYNEIGNILPLVEEFYKLRDKCEFELILVNDWSSDWSSQFLNEIKDNSRYMSFLRVVSYEKNRWYGWAILAWLWESKGNVLWWMHSDLQTDAKYIFEWFNLYKEMSQIHEKVLVKWVRVDRKFWQVFFSKMMSLFCTIVFFTPFSEINAQPKIFSRDLYEHFENPPTDFSLDLYLIILAKRHSCYFWEIVVNFIDRSFGESKWAFSFRSKIKTIMRTILYILKL